MKTLTYVLLGLVCVASLLGTLTFVVWSTSNNYETLKVEYNELVQEYNTLIQEYNKLLQEYNKLDQEHKALMENYTQLKAQINQTEYAVKASTAVSGDERLEVKCEVVLWQEVRVSVTNVGNEPIQKVYVFFMYSDPLFVYTYSCQTIHDLWMGETNTVTFYSLDYDRPFKVVAVGYP
jgi:hypothetical protein